MYARTENNIVTQLLRVDPATIFEAASAAEFVACDDSVQIGWVWDGETFTDPPPTPAVVPQQVTMRQARLALLGAGLLAGVDAAIAGLTEPAKSAAQIEWEYAAVVQRSSGLVPAMASALGLTDPQIDALFIAANQL